MGHDQLYKIIPIFAFSTAPPCPPRSPAPREGFHSPHKQKLSSDDLCTIKGISSFPSTGEAQQSWWHHGWDEILGKVNFSSIPAGISNPSSRRRQWKVAGGWNEKNFKVSSNSNHSRILWHGEFIQPGLEIFQGHILNQGSPRALQSSPSTPILMENLDPKRCSNGDKHQALLTQHQSQNSEPQETSPPLIASCPFPAELINW